MEYWKECISAAFDETGIAATDEQIDYVADCVDSAHENFGMAHGYECIQNPRDADVDELKKRIRELERERDEIENDFRMNVALRWNCSPSDVTLGEGGHAEVRR